MVASSSVSIEGKRQAYIAIQPLDIRKANREEKVGELT